MSASRKSNRSIRKASPRNMTLLANRQYHAASVAAPVAASENAPVEMIKNIWGNPVPANTREGQILKAYNNMRANEKAYQEEKRRKEQLKRAFPDSVALTAENAYSDYIKKPHFKTSLDYLATIARRYATIKRGVKGYCALVTRLEYMGLLDARDRVDFTNIRTLNILARTRGLAKMFENGILTYSAGDNPTINMKGRVESVTLVERPKRQTAKKDDASTTTQKSTKKTPKVDDKDAIIAALMKQVDELTRALASLKTSA